jgi:hypothetical protein
MLVLDNKLPWPASRSGGKWGCSRVLDAVQKIFPSDSPLVAFPAPLTAAFPPVNLFKQQSCKAVVQCRYVGQAKIFVASYVMLRRNIGRCNYVTSGSEGAERAQKALDKAPPPLLSNPPKFGILPIEQTSRGNIP